MTSPKKDAPAEAPSIPTESKGKETTTTTTKAPASAIIATTNAATTAAATAATTASTATTTTETPAETALQADVPPVAEELVADDDSAVGVTDDEISSASLRSSIMNYQVENGRRYHALSKGKYMWPNDEKENERLELQDYLFFLTLDGKKYLCPGAKHAKRVLDIGTGTGIWAIDYADEHPEATVIGVDLSPIQPSFVPPNVQFEVDDLEKPWTWSRKFDYIFSRMMIGSFADWDVFFQQAYDNLEPGGWFEVIDMQFPVRCDDDTMPEGNAFRKWIDMFMDGSAKAGRPLTLTDNHKQRLIDHGFVSVKEQTYKWPVGPWPKGHKHKEVGTWCLANLDSGLEGLSLALMTRVLGMSVEELMTFLVDVRKALRNPKMHAYFNVVTVYGQKPAA